VCRKSFVNYNNSSSYSICLACHMIQLLVWVKEQVDFLLTHMWGSHQFHPYNTHFQELVEDQRSKLTMRMLHAILRLSWMLNPKVENHHTPKCNNNVLLSDSFWKFFICCTLKIFYFTTQKNISLPNLLLHADTNDHAYNIPFSLLHIMLQHL
jgi:hypothetical protein